MGLIDLIKRMQEQKRRIQDANRAIEALNEFFSDKYVFLVPVLGKEEFCNRVTIFLIKKLESEGIMLTDESVKEVRDEIYYAVENTTYHLNYGFGGMVATRSFVRFISGVTGTFELFIQNESKVEPNERFLSKQEALNVTEYIYNYISKFIAWLKCERTPEDIENRPSTWLVSKKELKRFADEARNNRKVAMECLADMQRFAKEIEKNY